MVFLKTSATTPVYVNTYAFTPMIFLIIILMLLIYFAAFSSLGKTGNSSSSFYGDNNTTSTSSIIGTIIVVILIVLIIINAFEYFLNVNITAYLRGFFNPNEHTKHIDIVVNKGSSNDNPVPTIKFKKQVFNIPGNYYSFDNAKAICKAYGSELATYDQIEKSYKHGSEWCNYGWSADQMALFPTQSDTYNNLQNIKGHEHDCGRPGINGGYIANPNVRFGVNCYGNKPRITDEEEELMKTATPYPETAQDLIFQKRVDFWKTKVDDMLVSPFNYDTWGGL